jgi:hypothetical protein
MLLGSVPTPPQKPRSCTRTQSARHTAEATRSGRRRAPGFAVIRAAPVRASATTAKKLAPQPGAVPGPVGQGQERSGHAVDQHGAGGHRTRRRARGRKCPRRLPRTPTPLAPMRHWRLRRRGTHLPLRTASSHRPMPTWAHTASVGTVAWCWSHMVTSTPSNCCTQVGTTRGGLDHLPGHVERHQGLGLKQAVEDPQEPERDAQETPCRWSLASSPLVAQGIVTSVRKLRFPTRQVLYAGFPGRGQATDQPALNGATSGFMPE